MSCILIGYFTILIVCKRDDLPYGYNRSRYNEMNFTQMFQEFWRIEIRLHFYASVNVLGKLAYAYYIPQCYFWWFQSVTFRYNSVKCKANFVILSSFHFILNGCINTVQQETGMLRCLDNVYYQLLPQNLI